MFLNFLSFISLGVDVDKCNPHRLFGVLGHFLGCKTKKSEDSCRKPRPFVFLAAATWTRRSVFQTHPLAQRSKSQSGALLQKTHCSLSLPWGTKPYWVITACKKWRRWPCFVCPPRAADSHATENACEPWRGGTPAARGPSLTAARKGSLTPRTQCSGTLLTADAIICQDHPLGHKHF